MMIPDLAGNLLPLSAAFASGVLAAGRKPPAWLGWRGESPGLIRQRLRQMLRRLPSRRGRLVGVAVVSALMGIGAVTAYVSATPVSYRQPFETLPGAVVTVRGSGDQAALEIETEDGLRQLH